MENERVKSDFKDTSQRFRITDEEYKCSREKVQFNRYYKNRYRDLEPRVLAAARKVYGVKTERTRLSRLKSLTPTFIMGNFLKVSRRRPTIFAEFYHRQIVRHLREKFVDVPFESAVHPSDSIWIENDWQRLEMVGKVDKDEFSNGYVVGLFGCLSKNGLQFVIDRIFWPELGPQAPWPKVQKDVYLMFLSGVCIDSKVENNEAVFMAMNQLIEWLNGCGDPEDEDLARRVTRVIMAGDTIQISEESTQDKPLAKLGYVHAYDENAFEQADRVLQEIAKVVDLDLMSGQNDLCSFSWPQQPMLKRGVFPGCLSKASERFHTVTNPYSFIVDGVEFLGTSGQNLTDMIRYTSGQTPDQLMKQMLNGSHIAPSCPNTVDGFPFESRDPFVLHETPHVFFAGNQPQHLCKTVELMNGSRVVVFTIPMFRKKFEAVLFNVRTMETKTICFGQDLMNESI